MRAAWMLGALLLLAGCGSSPTVQFFTLSVEGGAGERATLPWAVQVVAVHIPDTLDRQQMVSASGPNVIEVRDARRWSAPLGPMIRRVLSEDLQRRFVPGTVVMPDAPAPPRTRRVVVTVAQFWREADGRVQLIGSWSLLRAGSDAPLLRRDVALGVPAEDGAEAEVAGMSRLLAELAGQIAATVRSAR